MVKYMLIIAVCDDNYADRNKIAIMIETYLQSYQIKGKIFAYDCAEKLLAAITENGVEFDIIFLDIIMGDVNGMTCARLIRQKDNRVRIAFLTSSTDYVYEGYEVNATRYLIKPVNEDKIVAFLEEAVAQVQEEAKESIIITCCGVTKKILISNILYLESKKNIVEIVLAQADESVTVYTTLDSFEQQHQSKMWIRPHKSFLVNFLYITQYKNDQFVLQDGIIIPISRTYKNTAKDRFYALLHDQ